MSEPIERWNILRAFLQKAPPEHMREALLQLHDKYSALICTQAGSAAKHHWWVGGYVQHVCEVCENVEWLGPSAALTEEEQELLSVAAYLHDFDKLWKYERESDPPTPKQLHYARGLGCVLDPNETKASISLKIEAAKEGAVSSAPPVIRPFRYIKDALAFNGTAKIQAVVASVGLVLPDLVLHAITFHHGGWSEPYMTHPTYSPTMHPVAVVLHIADLWSSHILGINEPRKERADPSSEE